MCCAGVAWSRGGSGSQSNSHPSTEASSFGGSRPGSHTAICTNSRSGEDRDGQPLLRPLQDTQQASCTSGVSGEFRPCDATARHATHLPSFSSLRNMLASSRHMSVDVAISAPSNTSYMRRVLPFSFLLGGFLAWGLQLFLANRSVPH